MIDLGFVAVEDTPFESAMKSNDVRFSEHMKQVHPCGMCEGWGKTAFRYGPGLGDVDLEPCDRCMGWGTGEQTFPHRCETWPR